MGFIHAEEWTSRIFQIWHKLFGQMVTKMVMSDAKIIEAPWSWQQL